MNHRKIFFLAGLMLLGCFLFGLQAESFRSGIKTHQDWITRYKKTLDYRILYILAGRSGLRVNKEKAQELSAYLEKYPENFEKVLTRFRILENRVEKNAEKEKEWLSRYGEEALVLTSQHYILLGTKKDRVSARVISYYMDRIYKYYEKKFKSKEKVEGHFIIRLFPSKESYMASGAPSFSAAYFSGAKKELVGYVPSGGGGSEKSLNDRMVRIFFHEGFHQFLGYYVPSPPSWLNEGLAKNFEDIVVQKSTLKEMNVIPSYRLRVLQEAIREGRSTELKKLIYMSQQELYTNPNLHYPQSWGLVHFLAHGSKKYNRYYKDIVKHLMEGKNLEEALGKTFAPTFNWKLFEKTWKKYILKLKPYKKSNNYIKFKK